VRGDLNFGEKRIEQSYESADAPERWDPHTRRVRANFNDVASCLRRSVWEELPYLRTPFGEDIVWSDCAQRAGYKVVFAPESVVVHSHEYPPLSLYPRTHVDGWLNKAYFDRYCMEQPSHVFIMTGRQFAEDRRFLRAKGLPAPRRWRESFTSLFYHFFEFAGFYLGGQLPGALGRAEAVRARSLKIVHAASPLTVEDPGEREALRRLAAGLSSAGHESSFLAGAGPGEEGMEKALRALGEDHALQRVSGGEAAGASGLEAQRAEIREQLLSLEPDVVHLADFMPFTCRVASLCRLEGIPYVVSLSDFWFCCPRGDLVRADGSFCDLKRPPRLACRACLAEWPELIFPASLIDKTLTALLARRRRSAPHRNGAALGPALDGGLDRAETIGELLNGARFIQVRDRLTQERLRFAGIREERVVFLGRREAPAFLGKLPAALRDFPDTMALFSARGRDPAPDRAVRQWIVKYRQALGGSRADARTGRASAPSAHGLQEGAAER